MLPIFIELSMYSSQEYREISVNPAQIEFMHRIKDYTNIGLTSKEILKVSESPGEIKYLAQSAYEEANDVQS